ILTDDQAEDQAEQQQDMADDQEMADDQAMDDEEMVDDEEMDDEQAVEEEMMADLPAIAIDEIELNGAMGSVLLMNTSSEAVSLEGWWICQRPAYWPLPALTLEPGAQLRIHAEAGEDTDDKVYAGGSFGNLGNNGEIALYSSAAFDNPDDMVSYVGWGNGGGRAGEARSAGLWGDTNLEASQGQAILRVADATGVEAYSVAELEMMEDDSGEEMMSGPDGFGPVVVDRLYLDGENMIQLRNIGDAAYSLDGHWLCQAPIYWPFPSGVELAPGATIFINTGSGSNTADTLFASVGSLSPSGGEIGLYRSRNFGSADDIASYIAWNSGGLRQSVAQTACIWADNLEASEGDVFVYDGFGEGTALYVKE
ncbi:MAG: hypothetical protein O6913_09965, partial [Chloroflexi bacterium]|nr:hypothetical protein [Chloroflexota bacterium]